MNRIGQIISSLIKMEIHNIQMGIMINNLTSHFNLIKKDDKITVESVRSLALYIFMILIHSVDNIEDKITITTDYYTILATKEAVSVLYDNLVLITFNRSWALTLITNDVKILNRIGFETEHELDKEMILVHDRFKTFNIVTEEINLLTQS